jgi:hypothetical protein
LHTSIQTHEKFSFPISLVLSEAGAEIVKMLLQHENIKTDVFHPNRRQADVIVHAIAKSKRIIVVTGAGISVAGGIPVQSPIVL